MTLTITPFLPFELGESNLARNAVESYKKYEKTGDYSCLKDCFANLFYVEKKCPEKKITAAKASDALARVTVDRYDDIYKKCFIANSADSALMTAKLDNQFWNNQYKTLADKILEEGMEPLQATEAGFGIFKEEGLIKAGMVFTPDEM